MYELPLEPNSITAFSDYTAAQVESDGVVPTGGTYFTTLDPSDPLLSKPLRDLQLEPQPAQSTNRGPKGKRQTAAMSSATNANASTDQAASRPKRVRTGCLTCRERHLKCDEGSPDCHNCKKSGRECKRGVRLNFIDTQCKTPPITPPTHNWDVSFLDESREIASEYKGGLGRYAHILPEDVPMPEPNQDTSFDFATGLVDESTLPQQGLPSLQSFAAEGMEVYSRNTDYAQDPTGDGQGSVASDSTFSNTTLNPPSHASYPDPQQTLTPPSEPRGPLNSAEELLFMQVFVEEVGLWMDSMDPYKHVGLLVRASYLLY